MKRFLVVAILLASLTCQADSGHGWMAAGAITGMATGGSVGAGLSGGKRAGIGSGIGFLAGGGLGWAMSGEYEANLVALKSLLDVLGLTDKGLE